MSLLLSLLACTLPKPPDPPVPDGARAVRVETPRTWFAEHGFHPLTPPIRAPKPSARGDVTVWVRVEGDGRITLADDGQLVWPPGSSAYRVEQRPSRDDRSHVVDVRGTELALDGTSWDHLWRPDGDALQGVAWPTTSDDRRDAVEWLAIVLGKREPLRSASMDFRTRWYTSLHRKANCTGCHVPSRPDATYVGDHGAVARGTDGTGWFTPRDLLRDTRPVETYGEGSPQQGSPHLTLTCPDGTDVVDGGCGNDVVVLGTFDLAAARAADDPHAEAVCASRRWVFDRADAAVRTHYAEAFGTCGIVAEDATNPG